MNEYLLIFFGAMDALKRRQKKTVHMQRCAAVYPHLLLLQEKIYQVTGRQSQHPSKRGCNDC
jgi:hypothetical protein